MMENGDQMIESLASLLSMMETPQWRKLVAFKQERPIGIGVLGVAKSWLA